MDHTYRALMKLLMLSMEASLMVVGPALTVVGLHSSISLAPLAVGGEGEKRVCRGDNAKRACQSMCCCCHLPLETGVERKRCLAKAWFITTDRDREEEDDLMGYCADFRRRRAEDGR
jgi:hypothetical protein